MTERIGTRRLVVAALLLALVGAWAYACASPTATSRWSASADAHAAHDLAAAVRVDGELDVPLSPGRGEALDLRLTNLTGGPVEVSDLVVRLDDVVAPRAGASRRCAPADFRVRQGGLTGLTIDAGDTVLLSETGLAVSRWPRLRMLDLPEDQDGCQGSRLELGFRVRGVAR